MSGKGFEILVERHEPQAGVDGERGDVGIHPHFGRRGVASGQMVPEGHQSRGLFPFANLWQRQKGIQGH